MGDGGRLWHGWALPLPGGAVCLDRDGAAAVLTLLKFYVTSSGGPHNGLRDTPHESEVLQELRAACERATRATSGPGHATRTSGRDPGVSTHRPDDLVDADHVAKELQVTTRHARRLISTGALGSVTAVGNAKAVRRFEVDAYHRMRSTR